MSNVGRIDRFTCASQSCDGEIVTVERADGVPPRWLDCPKCGGMLTSTFNSPVDKHLTPTHELVAQEGTKKLKPQEISKEAGHADR